VAVQFTSPDRFSGAGLRLIATAVATAGDFDVDGTRDVSVFRDGIWYQLQSTNGFAAHYFGLAGDIPTESAYSR
jgi:hypothetical protein